MLVIGDVTGGFGQRVWETAAFLLALFVALCVREQVKGRKNNYEITKDILKIVQRCRYLTRI